MSKGNGKTNVEGEVFDVEHELPAADEQDATTGEPVSDASVEAEAQDEVGKLKADNAAYLDRLARLQAEFDNFRKRNAREQQEYREYAIADAIKQFLPILDSLDRAAKTPASSLEDVQKGIELIDRQFHDALSRLGVEPVPAEGEFDPNLHQAIQMVETSEVADNHVVDELQRGYRLRDRLLRPAMVRVAQNSGK